MLKRTGAVVIRMLEDVKQVTIGPLIERMISKGSVVYTDEYDIYGRLDDWGYCLVPRKAMSCSCKLLITDSNVHDGCHSIFDKFVGSGSQ
jgi:hypothetical protein